jgi:hypothetical protein
MPKLQIISVREVTIRLKDLSLWKMDAMFALISSLGTIRYKDLSYGNGGPVSHYLKWVVTIRPDALPQWKHVSSVPR